MAREVFKIVDLVVTFQEEPGLDVYLIFELQDAKVKTSVFRNAGSQAGVRFTDNLMLPKSDWGPSAPPGADELLVKAYRFREAKPDQLLGAAIISLSDLPSDGRVQAQLLMRQDAFGGVMDFKLDGAGFGDTVVKSSKVVQASDEEYSDQNVPVGTVVSRRVVSGIPEGMAEGAQGGGAQPGAGEPGMNPQQPRQREGAALLGAGAAAGVAGIGGGRSQEPMQASTEQVNGAQMAVDYARNNPPANGANLSSAPSPRTPAAGGSSPLDKEGSGISTTSSASRRPAIVPFKPSGGGGGGGAGASRAAQTPAAAEALKEEGAATGPGVSATQAAGVQGLGRGLERHRYAQEHPEAEGRRLQGEAFGAAAGVLGAAAAMRRQQMDRDGAQSGKGSVSNPETPFGQDGVQTTGKGETLGASGSQAPPAQNQSVNVSQNVSQAAPQQQQPNGGLMAQGTTVTHHHYHLLNHAGGPEVLAAMGVAGADQAALRGPSGKVSDMTPSMTPPMTPSHATEQSVQPPSSQGNSSSQPSPAPSFSGAVMGATAANAAGASNGETQTAAGPARGMGRQSASSISITDIQARLLHHSTTAKPYVTFQLGSHKVMTEPFKTKSTDLQPVVMVGDSLTLPVDVTDLNPANHVLRVMLYNKRAMRSDALIGLSSVALGAVTEAAVDGAAMVQLTLEDRIDRRPTGSISFHVHVTPSAVAGVETAGVGTRVGEKQGGTVYGEKDGLAAEQ